MCGICGIVDSRRPVEESTVHEMTMALRHRGPDGDDTVSLGNCVLGHSRLSIIDLETGDQPMADISRRYYITFNGEIYNYKELRKSLLSEGAKFETKSDTEVILQAYIHYGEDAPKYLNGQFAFFIWDSQEQVGFAARDRFGEKPFYWAENDSGTWVFASEIKAILASGAVRPVLNLQTVDMYLALLYVPPDRTIYQNIHTLPSGHALVWRAGKTRQWQYWRPCFSTNDSIDVGDAVKEIQRLTGQAVYRQMVSDVPIGAFLSGGLDSSTIVALMSSFSSFPVQTFSVGFGDLINELPYAEAVAKKYNTDHHQIQMDISVCELLYKMADSYDEPFADSSNIPTFLLSQYARRYVKVALSGDGGDELFGGYQWYENLIVSERTRQQGWAERKLWKLLRRFDLLFERAYQQRLALSYFAEVRQKYPDLLYRHWALHTDLMAPRSTWWGTTRQTFDTLGTVASAFRPLSLHPMDRVSEFDGSCYLTGDILVKVDRAALAHGLETRAPFLDVDLVEFVWSLPSRLRFTGKTSKPLLRSAFKEMWAPQVRNRSKQGFGAPVHAWLRQPDVMDLAQHIFAQTGALRELLPGLPLSLEDLPAQQQWTLLVLGLWLERRSSVVDWRV